MKKGTMKKLLSMCMAMLVLVIALMPAPVSAADYTIKTLNAGTWAKASYNYNTGKSTYYMITVPKSGALTFTLQSDDNYSGVGIFKSKSDAVNYTFKNSVRWVNYSDKSKSVAVDAGTYYLRVEADKCKYSFKATANKANYRKTKALALKAGTKLWIAQSPNANYSRWYKITTTSKKKLYIASNWGRYYSNVENIAIYNSKGKRIETIANGSELKICTKSKMPKGTYYICVSTTYSYPGDNDYAFGNVITLKWA